VRFRENVCENEKFCEFSRKRKISQNLTVYCMHGECGNIFEKYHHILGGSKEHMCNVRIQLPLGLKRKFRFTLRKFGHVD
jgi:hypothetical protein